MQIANEKYIQSSGMSTRAETRRCSASARSNDNWLKISLTASEVNIPPHSIRPRSGGSTSTFCDLVVFTKDYCVPRLTISYRHRRTMSYFPAKLPAEGMAQSLFRTFLFCCSFFTVIGVFHVLFLDGLIVGEMPPAILVAFLLDVIIAGSCGWW